MVKSIIKAGMLYANQEMLSHLIYSANRDPGVSVGGPFHIAALAYSLRVPNAAASAAACR